MNKKIMSFDGEPFVLEGNVITCPTKETYLLLDEIEKFALSGLKRIVGMNGTTKRPCYIWRDNYYVHIDCLKETISSFNEKLEKLKLQIYGV